MQFIKRVKVWILLSTFQRLNVRWEQMNLLVQVVFNNFFGVFDLKRLVCCLNSLVVFKPLTFDIRRRLGYFPVVVNCPGVLSVGVPEVTAVTPMLHLLSLLIEMRLRPCSLRRIIFTLLRNRQPWYIRVHLNLTYFVFEYPLIFFESFLQLLLYESNILREKLFAFELVKFVNAWDVDLFRLYAVSSFHYRVKTL